MPDNDTESRREVQEYADETATKYDLDRLREWSKSILTTHWDERAGMVLEDPTVLDVAHAYIIRLEARFAAMLAVRTSPPRSTEPKSVEHLAARDAIRNRCEGNAVKRRWGFITWSDAGAEMLAEARTEIENLRAAIDPALRDRCNCCRKCGPSIPCGVTIETLGASCAGSCFCESGS